MLSSQINAFNTELILCDIDQKACSIMDLISYKLSKLLNNVPFDKNKVLNVISKYLPCSYCFKVIKIEVDFLSNVRLGKHERRILLLAPPPEGDPEIIEQGDVGIRAYESHLRAIRKLEKFRFLWKSRKEKRRIAVRLTPLGHSIAKLLGQEFLKRNPIRWSKFKPDLIKEASLSTDDLLRKFESRIKYDKLLEVLYKEGQSDNTSKLGLYTSNLLKETNDLGAVGRSLEKREALIKAILKNPIDPTILVDKQRTILEANYIACEFFSRTENNLVGLHIDELFSSDKTKDVINKINDLFYNGEVAYLSAMVNDTKVLLIVMPIFDIDNSINRLSIFIRRLAGSQIVSTEAHEVGEYKKTSI